MEMSALAWPTDPGSLVIATMRLTPEKPSLASLVAAIARENGAVAKAAATVRARIFAGRGRAAAGQSVVLCGATARRTAESARERWRRPAARETLRDMQR